MKIVLVTNRSLIRSGIPRLDAGYWNFYLPLLELGHQVYFYDITNPIEKDFSKILEAEKPDLIFCMLTGNKTVGKYEPLEEIQKETKTGRTITFNWFCDDTWRYETYSKNICKYFTFCSTPEPSYINKYKNDGYGNILLGNWHTNTSIYPSNIDRNIDVGFVGNIGSQRKKSLSKILQSGFNVRNIHGVSQEDLLLFYCQSKIGINFSINENDEDKKTQMKLRMFEVPAAQALLLTEYHETIEDFFKIDKEIITFKEEGEMIEKISFLLKNSSLMQKIAKNGYERVVREHDSKIRLSKLLEQIK